MRALRRKMRLSFFAVFTLTSALRLGEITRTDISYEINPNTLPLVTIFLLMPELTLVISHAGSHSEQSIHLHDGFPRSEGIVCLPCLLSVTGLSFCQTLTCFVSLPGMERSEQCLFDRPWIMGALTFSNSGRHAWAFVSSAEQHEIVRFAFVLLIVRVCV